jgi:hypothetical protein
MGQESHEIVLDDGIVLHVNDMNPFDIDDLAMDAIALLSPIGAALGSLGIASGGSVEDLLNRDLSEIGLGRAFESLGRSAQGFDRKLLRDMQKKLMSVTIYKSKPINDEVFHGLFHGHYMRKWKWLIAALKVQLGPFGKELLGLVKDNGLGGLLSLSTSGAGPGAGSSSSTGASK